MQHWMFEYKVTGIDANKKQKQYHTYCHLQLCLNALTQQFLQPVESVSLLQGHSSVFYMVKHQILLTILQEQSVSKSALSMLTSNVRYCTYWRRF